MARVAPSRLPAHGRMVIQADPAPAPALARCIMPVRIDQLTTRGAPSRKETFLSYIMPRVFNFMNGIRNFLRVQIRAIDDGHGASTSVITSTLVPGAKSPGVGSDWSFLILLPP